MFVGLSKAGAQAASDFVTLRKANAVPLSDAVYEVHCSVLLSGFVGDRTTPQSDIVIVGGSATHK